MGLMDAIINNRRDETISSRKSQFSPEASGSSIVGYWWSTVDNAWVPVYLDEAREATGQPNLTYEQGRDWANSGQIDQNQPGAILTLETDRLGPRATDYALQFDAPVDGGGGGGGGRGGGSGAAAPVYVAPNRDEIEEQLKSYVVATTGKNNPTTLKKATDAYLKAHKAAWQQQVNDSGGEAPSPFMAAKEIVRGTDAYKTIHFLRPDSVDEMDWVTGTQGKLRQLGLSASRAEELGIAQAKGGSTDEELMRSAETDKLTRNKVMADSQRRRIQDAARSVVSMIK